MHSAPKLAYLCFDVVPAAKGAAIHIEAFAKAIGQAFGTLHLVTVSPTFETRMSTLCPGVRQVAFPALGKTLIDRVLYWRRQVMGWLSQQPFDQQPFDVIHIRSIYEGFPIAQQKPRFCRSLIFEVNGMPSIELKYRYPKVTDDRELMHKLIAQEQTCIAAADRLITPSPVTREYLIQRGADPERIQVIPNGVDLSIFTYQSPRARLEGMPLHLLYFGTLSAWQGVNLVLQAMAMCDFPVKLTVAAAARPDQTAALQKTADKLGVAEQVRWLDPLPQTELVAEMHQADAILAPLTANDRNLVQGCCPLKVLEGMAAGTPVITSDLPVIRAIGNPDTHFLAVRSSSAKALKDALLRLRADDPLRQDIAIAARQQIEQHFTWQQAGAALVNLYRSLLQH